MGDHIKSFHLRQQFLNLDSALARDDRLAASLATERINALTLSLRPQPAKSNQFVQNLPRWMRSIVKNKGVRVPALERAFGANKVVITGRVGSRNMLELKINF